MYLCAQMYACSPSGLPSVHTAKQTKQNKIMAALQKIRSNTWIIAVMGVGLFLFLLTMVLDQNTISALTSGNRNVGEVYGQSLSQQEYFDMVNEATQVQKLRSGGVLTEEQNEQIREQVWQDHVVYELISKECKKLGIIVTDAEVQQALKEGTAQSFQNVPMFAGQDGRFDYTALQQFFKQTKELKGQQNNPQVAEQIETINRLWAYTEKQLRRELLLTKYQALFMTSFTSNPVSAKAAFDARNQMADATVATIPFASIDDKEAAVNESDLKKVYKQYKEMFRLDAEARDIKYIDVAVTASAADKKALQEEMNSLFGKLQASSDPAVVINASKSQVRYSGLPLASTTYPSDIKMQLDSMSVGQAKAPYYEASDNTMNIVKLIAKTQAPDSVLYRALPVQAANTTAMAARADSIVKALNGGSKFADVAKKIGVPSDSMWVTAQQLESTDISAENAKFVRALYDTPLNSYTTLELNGVKVVLQVMERKAMKTKLTAAVVKVPVDFSKATYEAAVSKFNRFLAANRSLADLEKNAAKEGYQLVEQNRFTSSFPTIGAGMGPGVAGSKEAIRWVFDTAEEGEVSPLYQVGKANDHLLVVALSRVHDGGYLGLDNKEVKEFVTAVAKSQKKGEVAAKRLEGVKTIEQAKAKGAIVDQLTEVSLNSYAMVPAVGYPEPTLISAILSTKKGQTTGVVLGTGGAYLAKVTATQTNKTEKFDAKMEMTMQQRGYMQSAQQVLGALAREANIQDRRYKF